MTILSHAIRCYRVGALLLALHRAKVRHGEDWSVRINSSFCSGEPCVIVTVFKRTRGGGLSHVPKVAWSLEEALEWAGRQG